MAAVLFPAGANQARSVVDVSFPGLPSKQRVWTQWAGTQLPFLEGLRCFDAIRRLSLFNPVHQRFEEVFLYFQRFVCLSRPRCEPAAAVFNSRCQEQSKETLSIASWLAEEIHHGFVIGNRNARR